jgi:vacuolar-type H+-ATPase subunit F/Vma7
VYKIEVIGDLDFGLGFSLAGVEDIKSLKGKELAKYIENLIKEKKKKIVLIQNEYFKELPGRVRVKILTSINPLFIVLGEGQSDDLSLMVKRVFGVDLLNKK